MQITYNLNLVKNSYFLWKQQRRLMLPAHLKEMNDLLELTVTIYHLLQTHHAYQINTFTLLRD